MLTSIYFLFKFYCCSSTFSKSRFTDLVYAVLLSHKFLPMAMRWFILHPNKKNRRRRRSRGRMTALFAYGLLETGLIGRFRPMRKCISRSRWSCLFACRSAGAEIYPRWSCFPVAAPRAWNSLPPSLWTVFSLVPFRHQLKTFLFVHSFDWHSLISLML